VGRKKKERNPYRENCRCEDNFWMDIRERRWDAFGYTDLA
jgi:hypothetical protein